MKRVRMIVARQFLDAGVERPLDRGGEYLLPIVVADSLVATGVAVVVEEARVAKPSEPPAADPPKANRPPETKPTRAPETKGLKAAS